MASRGNWADMGNGKRTTPGKGQAEGGGKGLHPRNRERYDFAKLVKSCPELGPYVRPNPFGDISIDFADPAAVRTLNRALLTHFYGVAHWDIPLNCLCPPIPGRADYLHYLADLLGSGNGGVIPRGPGVRVLDIGVGANCVYPLLGQSEYGWRFTGSEVDPRALAAASAILRSNRGLSEAIELRLQASPGNILRGVLQPGEVFDLAMCNPPFHASLADAREGTQRKWRNLGKARDEGDRPLAKLALRPPRAPHVVSGPSPDTTSVLNFGGQGAELWCPGGEAAFVGRMIEESLQFRAQCLWFTTLVSKSANLPGVRAALKRAGALEVRTIEMAQGQKKSRFVAWTFLGEEERQAWRTRWIRPAGK